MLSSRAAVGLGDLLGGLGRGLGPGEDLLGRGLLRRGDDGQRLGGGEIALAGVAGGVRRDREALVGGQVGGIAERDVLPGDGLVLVLGEASVGAGGDDRDAGIGAALERQVALPCLRLGGQLLEPCGGERGLGRVVVPGLLRRLPAGGDELPFPLPVNALRMPPKPLPVPTPTRRRPPAITTARPR
jgi:hypothetical protein